MRKVPAVIIYFLSLCILFLIWTIAARTINASLILPGPVLVFKTLKSIIITSSFWKNYIATFLRVLISFAITVLLGSVIGFLCGISTFAEDFFELPISIIRSTPVVAFILVAYFWFTSDSVPVFVSVLMGLPIMITSVSTGFKSVDKNLLNMAKSYEFSNREIVKYIKIPQSKPYFINGALSSFGLSWKVVAAGEVICLPKQAIGTLLQKSQIHLESAEVIAQTIVLVFVSFVIERIFGAILKKNQGKNE